MILYQTTVSVAGAKANDISSTSKQLKPASVPICRLSSHHHVHKFDLALQHSPILDSFESLFECLDTTYASRCKLHTLVLASCAYKIAKTDSGLSQRKRRPSHLASGLSACRPSLRCRYPADSWHVSLVELPIDLHRASRKTVLPIRSPHIWLPLHVLFL